MVQSLWRPAALVLVILALAVAVFPMAAPSQSLEDLVVRSLEITAELRPVPFNVTCASGSCRITQFGALRGKTVANLQVTSPNPVVSARMILDSDLKVRSITGLPLTFRRDGDYIVLNFNPPLAPGVSGIFTFEYEGNPWFVWDDLIIADNAVLYPILVSPFGDEGANRATIKTTISIPSGYLLASTGRMIRQEAGGLQTYQWETGEPVTWMGVIGGKVFRAVERQAGQIALTILIRPQYERFADQIGDFTQKAAEFYSRLIYPIPYERVSVVVAPPPFFRGVAFAYPSLFVVPEEAFTGRSGGASTRDSLRFKVVAHEAAHTYFPGQTSSRGIAYLWLFEGFAEYLGLMAVEALMGRPAFLKELDENRQGYAQFVGRDKPVGAYTRINARSADGTAVNYDKGSFILHMLRFVVGDETFRKILQTYATRFRGQSVRVDDFAHVASEVAGRDLAWFFQEWITERVLPDYTITEATSALVEGGFRTTVKVRNAGTGVMPVDILFEQEGGERMVKRVEVGSGATVEVRVTTLRRVTKVEADPEKWILQSNYANDASSVR